MQSANEILRQWHLLNSSFFGHHLQTDITCCHFLYILHISFSDYLAKQK